MHEKLNSSCIFKFQGKLKCTLYSVCIGPKFSHTWRIASVPDVFLWHGYEFRYCICKFIYTELDFKEKQSCFISLESYHGKIQQMHKHILNHQIL